MSTLKIDTLSNLAGTKSVPTNTVVDGSAKAWVNFNGTGTVAIRAAFNVSSITDNSVGNYTVNFSSAMPDALYAVVTGSANEANNRDSATNVITPATGSVAIQHIEGFVPADASRLCLAVFS